MEHRWGRRVAVDVPVTLRLASGQLVLGRIADISLSGALIHTRSRLPWLGRVAVLLAADESRAGQPRTVWAHIVRTNHDSAGLEWSDFSPAAVCALLAEAGDVPAELIQARAHARA